MQLLKITTKFINLDTNFKRLKLLEFNNFQFNVKYKIFLVAKISQCFRQLTDLFFHKDKMIKVN